MTLAMVASDRRKNSGFFGGHLHLAAARVGSVRGPCHLYIQDTDVMYQTHLPLYVTAAKRGARTVHCSSSTMVSNEAAGQGSGNTSKQDRGGGERMGP